MFLNDAQKEQFFRDGYVRVPGLLAPELVAQTKARLLASLDIRENDPQTWQNKPSHSDANAVLAMTVPARTENLDATVREVIAFVREFAGWPPKAGDGARC